MSTVEPTAPLTLSSLSVPDRLQILEFVCAFAWADFKVRSSERELIARLVQHAELDAEAAGQVESWLQRPPSPDEIDPLDVPAAHRPLLLALVLELITADGEISPEESETYNLLSQLLA